MERYTIALNKLNSSYEKLNKYPYGQAPEKDIMEFQDNQVEYIKSFANLNDKSLMTLASFACNELDSYLDIFTNTQFIDSIERHQEIMSTFRKGDIMHTLKNLQTLQGHCLNLLKQL